MPIAGKSKPDMASIFMDFSENYPRVIKSHRSFCCYRDVIAKRNNAKERISADFFNIDNGLKARSGKLTVQHLSIFQTGLMLG